MVKTRRPNENFELEEVDVAIVAESTYPFLKGGVSAVVHDIITNNPELTFGIIHIAWDSESPTEYLYDVPGNVLWVDMIYLSMLKPAWHCRSFSIPLQNLTATAPMKWPRSSCTRLTRLLVIIRSLCGICTMKPSTP